MLLLVCESSQDRFNTKWHKYTEHKHELLRLLECCGTSGMTFAYRPSKCAISFLSVVHLFGYFFSCLSGRQMIRSFCTLMYLYKQNVTHLTAETCRLNGWNAETASTKRWFRPSPATHPIPTSTCYTLNSPYVTTHALDFRVRQFHPSHAANLASATSLLAAPIWPHTHSASNKRS